MKGRGGAGKLLCYPGILFSPPPFFPGKWRWCVSTILTTQTERKLNSSSVAAASLHGRQTSPEQFVVKLVGFFFFPTIDAHSHAQSVSLLFLHRDQFCAPFPPCPSMAFQKVRLSLSFFYFSVCQVSRLLLFFLLDRGFCGFRNPFPYYPTLHVLVVANSKNGTD